MNEKPTIIPKTLPPLTKFIYTLGALPTSYLMSMSFEEQLVWLCNYLGTQVIPAVNQNGEAVEELQNLYELLRNYVNDYFDNLDVQEEVNNKLDEMVDDGTLADILQNYTSITKVYNTFNDMYEDTGLVNNSKCKTLGYYSINDGGGATYLLSENEPSNTYYETLNNGMYAILIYENEINIKQIGCKNTNNYDNSTKINNLLQLGIPVYIPAGTWLMENINIQKGNIIRGDFSFTTSDDKNTIIKSINGNSIFIFGNESTPVTSIKIEDMCFTSPNAIDNVWLFNYCYFSNFKNIYFHKVNGHAIKFKSAWELTFNNTNIRHTRNKDKHAILFDEVYSGNQSAIYFDTINFEQCIGGLIKCSTDSVVSDLTIDNLFYEEGVTSQDDDYEQSSQNTINPSYFDIPLIQVDRASLFNINNITTVNTGNYYYTINNNYYQHASIFYVSNDSKVINLNVNSINIGSTKDTIIVNALKCYGTTTITNARPKITLNQISSRNGFTTDINSNLDIRIKDYMNNTSLEKYTLRNTNAITSNTLFNKISYKAETTGSIFQNIPSYKGKTYTFLIYVPEGSRSLLRTQGLVEGVSTNINRVTTDGDNAWHEVSFENTYDSGTTFNVRIYDESDSNTLYNSMLIS